jgi:tricorn protease-like protein
VPFDLDSLAVTGTGAPVLDGVQTASSNGGAQYQFSNNGTLVMVPGTDEVADNPEWLFVGPDGTVAQAWSPDGFAYGSVLSPDGSRLVATVVGEDGQQNLWSWDRGRAAVTRITFSRLTDIAGVWMPDGRELIYSSSSDGPFRLYRVRADGSGEGEPLPNPIETAEFAQSISADGRWLLTRRHDAGGARSLWVRDLTGDDAARLVLEIEDTISQAALSPDAGWIAYTSNESGDWEVYALPFLAEGGEKVTVSVGGGGMPRWSEDGRRIYYRSEEGVSAVDLEVVDGRLRPGAPQPLFEGPYFGGPVGYEYGDAGLTNFDAGGDGATFVMQQVVGGAPAQTSAVVVFNWFDELKRLVPTRR